VSPRSDSPSRDYGIIINIHNKLIFSMRLVKALLAMAALTVITVGTLLLWTTSYVRSLPEVDNMAQFSLAFDPLGQEPVSLERYNLWDHILGQSAELPKTSLFPAMRGLEFTSITDASDPVAAKDWCQERQIVIDPLWRVFWISLTSCSFDGTPLDYFGPYHLK